MLGSEEDGPGSRLHDDHIEETFLVMGCRYMHFTELFWIPWLCG
jgi:hypothetical protein